MEDSRKEIYRDLLRWAMVDMRMHSAATTSAVMSLISKRRSHRSVLQFIYAMNNWLHNAALYSAINFEGFKEELFWEDYERFRRDFPAKKWAGLTESIIRELQSTSS